MNNQVTGEHISVTTTPPYNYEPAINTLIGLSSVIFILLAICLTLVLWFKPKI